MMATWFTILRDSSGPDYRNLSIQSVKCVNEAIGSTSVPAAVCEHARPTASKNTNRNSLALENEARRILLNDQNTTTIQWWVVRNCDTHDECIVLNITKFTDYAYLEDVSRRKEAMQRTEKDILRRGNNSDFKRQFLKNHFARYGILFEEMPRGMSRRAQNKTNLDRNRYLYKPCTAPLQ